jgi:tetratricopeptide (TPR) repeat protein
LRIRQFLFACMIASLLLVSACRKDPEVAKRQYLESGQQFLQQGKYQQAEIQFRNALKIDPRFADAYLQLSKASIATAHWQDAFGNLQRAMQLDPNLTEAHLTISRLYLSSRQFDQAEEQALEILKREPNNVEAYQLLGSIYLNSGREPEAREAFAHCIQLAPNDASGYLNLGLMELSLHNYPAAERDLLKAKQVNPQMPVAYSDLANFYRVEQHLPDAEKVLREGIARIPDAYPLTILLAEVLVAESRQADAESQLQNLLSAHGDVPEVAAAVGDFYAGLGSNQHAIDAYQRGLAAAPKSIELHNRIIAIYLSTNRIAEAEAMNQKISKESPHNPTANVQRAQILIAQNRFDDAVQLLDRQVSDTPDFALAHYVLGTAQWRRGAVEQARTAYQDAVRLSPGMIEAWKSLTQLLLSRGEVNSARLYAQRCIQLEPGAAAGHLLLGTAYLATAEYDRAREEFAVAQRLSPRDPWPHARMAKAWAAQKHIESAEHEFQLALALQPDNPTLFGDYFEFLLNSAQPSRAADRARQFAAAHPTDAEAQRLLATVLVHRQLYPEAETVAERAVLLAPRMLSAYLTLGSVQEKLGETDAALATYNRAISLEPNYPPLLTIVGNLYLQKNDLDSARRCFQQALSVDPNFAIAEANLAWVYAQRGENLDVALGLAQKARQQLPALESIADTLGWVQYKKGDYSSAKSLLQDCVKTAPQQANYHYHLGMVLLATGDHTRARAEIENALRLKLSGDGERDARHTLETLQ